MRAHALFLSAAAAALLALAACGGGDTAPKAADTVATATLTSAGDSGATSLTVAPQGAVAAGRPITLTLTLKDAKGAPLGPDAIAVSHTEKVHVMIVDAGLEDYTHAHAAPGAAPGEWTVSFTPKFARSYRVWTDFKLASAAGEDHSGHDHGAEGHDHGEHGDEHGQTPSALLTVGGDAAPAVAAAQSLTAQAGGLTFTMSLGGPVTADAHVPATLAVTDASGQPFAGLEPIMGAYAHLVGFSADGASMLHAHPEGAEPKDAGARGGPVLTFDLHAKVAGPNRLFLQVQKDGAVITVPFTLMVSG